MKKEIEKLKTGQCYIVRESGYGKAEIWKINNVYILFEVPLFGGEPVYVDTYNLNQIENVIYTITSWN